MLLFEAKSPQNLKSKNTTGYNAIFRFLISLLFVIRLLANIADANARSSNPAVLGEADLMSIIRRLAGLKA